MFSAQSLSGAGFLGLRKKERNKGSDDGNEAGYFRSRCHGCSEMGARAFRLEMHISSDFKGLYGGGIFFPSLRLRSSDWRAAGPRVLRFSHFPPPPVNLVYSKPCFDYSSGKAATIEFSLILIFFVSSTRRKVPGEALFLTSCFRASQLSFLFVSFFFALNFRV